MKCNLVLLFLLKNVCMSFDYFNYVHAVTVIYFRWLGFIP